EPGQVALGMVLAEIYRHIRDPPCMLFVMTEWLRAYRPAHSPDHFRGGLLDERLQPQGAAAAAAIAVVGIRVDLVGRRVEHGARGVEGDVDSAEMSEPVRADIAFGRGGEKRLGYAARPAIPARGNARPAMGESRPGEVAIRLTDRSGHDVDKADIKGVTGRHADCRPA